jgi:hypothetical protein
MNKDIQKKGKKILGSNRSFGLVFFFVFFIIAFWNLDFTHIATCA